MDAWQLVNRVTSCNPVQRSGRCLWASPEPQHWPAQKNGGAGPGHAGVSGTAGVFFVAFRA